MAEHHHLENRHIAHYPILIKFN